MNSLDRVFTVKGFGYGMDQFIYIAKVGFLILSAMTFDRLAISFSR
jgi:hypothetical protein